MPVISSSQRGNTVIVPRPSTTAVERRDTRTLRVQDGRVVRVVSQSTSAVEIAAPGPQGPRGLDGVNGGVAVERIAAADLGGHRVVRALDALQVEYADSANPDHGDDTLGITSGAASVGAVIEVLTGGPLAFNGWAWTPGEPVFLGSNGLLTQSSPAAGFTQVIGFAQDATTIFIGVEPPIYLD